MVSERRERDRRYEASHPEQIKAKAAKLYREHRDERIKYFKRYYAKNLEKRLEYSRKYYQEHKAERAAYHRDYMAKHGKKVAEKRKRLRLARVLSRIKK